MTLTDRMEKERTKVKHEMQLKIDKLKEDFNAVKVELKQVRKSLIIFLYFFYNRVFTSLVHRHHLYHLPFILSICLYPFLFS